MRYVALILIIILSSLTMFAQTPDPNLAENTNTETKVKTEENVGGEKEDLKNAIALSAPAERISALQKFIRDYPESEEKNRALELIVGARAAIAAEKLRLGEVEEGVNLFKLAVKESPTPVSDKLFSGVLLQIPTNVFVRGQRVAAFDIAQTIEEKIGDNAKQIAALATFYLGIEYSTAARKLAQKAIELEPELASAHQTLGLANRIGFNLPKAEEGYTKALELDPDSIVSKRSLAEIKRALGKSDEATTLYKEILEKKEDDATAKTGWILSLFDAGKKDEAEAEMAKELEANPKNVPLLVGAAYWYATQKNGEKAVAMANQAIQAEPRYTWAYIALARGHMLQGSPLSAETALLTGRQFGNFPTLSFELALAQSAAGFYKEAAEELKKNFTIEDGKVVTSLGGRIEAEGDNFIELLSLERKAGIFAPNAANDIEKAKKLQALLEFENKLAISTVDEIELAEAAENFAGGDDGMKTHRNLYVANQLIEKKKALPKAMELTQRAVEGVQDALNVSSPSSAVLADELYETRNLARTRGQNVVVPDIPTPTLTRIIRGRIEETAGWTLYNQEKYEESLAKLNLAMSILPKDSAWWRSTLWKRGMVFEKMEKPKEALDSYVKSYASEIANADQPSTVKKVVVETLYQQVNGSLDGLEEKLKDSPKDETNTSAIFVKKSEPEEKPKEDKKKDDEVPDIVPIAKDDSTDASKKPSEDEKLTLNEDILDPTKAPKEKPSETDDKKPVDSEKNIEDISLPDSNNSTSKEIPSEDTNKTTDKPTDKPKEEAKNTSLFDPIIIDIPRTDIEQYKQALEEEKKKEEEKKSEDNANKTNETKADENEIKRSDLPKTDDSNPKEPTKPAEENISDLINKDDSSKEDSSKPAEAKTSDESAKTDSSEKPKTDETNEKENDSEKTVIDLGATRPRVVAKEEKKEEPKLAECEIVVSQEVVSIINTSGGIGILVGLKGLEENKQKDIKATSSSPEDVEVVYEPEIGAVAGQSFFLIKSISSNKGAFTVTFETPCGKKDIMVKVR